MKRIALNISKLIHFGILTTMAIFFTANSNLYSQVVVSECKVLIEKIVGTHEGACKNGFAHGKGVSQGIDKYEGKFKKGKPDGKGKYTWSNGDYYYGAWRFGKRHGNGTYYSAKTKKEIKGLWKNDKMVSEKKVRSYQVSSLSKLERVDFYEKKGGTPGSIEIVFKRDGSERRMINGLNLVGSSGSSRMSMNFSGFDNIMFPFTGTVSFIATTRMNSGSYNCSFRFKINKEAAWKVTVYY